LIGPQGPQSALHKQNKQTNKAIADVLDAVRRQIGTDFHPAMIAHKRRQKWQQQRIEGINAEIKVRVNRREMVTLSST
jgi:hypothetical protein